MNAQQAQVRSVRCWLHDTGAEARVRGRESILALIKALGPVLAVPGAGVAAVTRQTALPTSSATNKPPRRSIATPTGRPRASPASFTKPVNTSVALPAGTPFANGTKITL